MKGELEGGVGHFYFKQLLLEIVMSKCTKNIWRSGSARIPLGSPSAPPDPLAIVGGHREETKSSHSLAAVRCAKCREGNRRNRKGSERGERQMGTYYSKPSLPEASFSAQNAPENVWRPGSAARTRWGSLSAPLSPNGSGCGRFATRWRRFAVKNDCLPS